MITDCRDGNTYYLTQLGCLTADNFTIDSEAQSGEVEVEHGLEHRAHKLAVGLVCRPALAVGIQIAKTSVAVHGFRGSADLYEEESS